MYGSAGGSLPSQTVNNKGGVVLANIKIMAGSELEFVIGQQGESPCDSEQLRKHKIVNLFLNFKLNI